MKKPGRSFPQVSPSPCGQRPEGRLDAGTAVPAASARLPGKPSSHLWRDKAESCTQTYNFQNIFFDLSRPVPDSGLQGPPEDKKSGGPASSAESPLCFGQAGPALIRFPNEKLSFGNPRAGHAHAAQARHAVSYSLKRAFGARNSF